MKVGEARALVEQRAQLVGRRITEVDDTAGEHESRIRDVVMRRNGDSQWFAFVTEDGVECGGDVAFLSLSGNIAQGILLLRNRFGTHWEVEGPTQLRAV